MVCWMTLECYILYRNQTDIRHWEPSRGCAEQQDNLTFFPLSIWRQRPLVLRPPGRLPRQAPATCGQPPTCQIPNLVHNAAGYSSWGAPLCGCFPPHFATASASSSTEWHSTPTHRGRFLIARGAETFVCHLTADAAAHRANTQRADNVGSRKSRCCWTLMQTEGKQF